MLGMLAVIISISLIKFGLSIYVSSFYPKFEETIKEPWYMTTVVLNFLGGLAIFLASFYGSNIYTKLDYPSLRNILLVLFLYDAFYYWTHYVAHNTPWLYEITHKIHHAHIKLMPLDAFHNDLFENMMYSLLLCSFPLLFVENLIEYAIFILIFYFHTLYLHSESNSNFFLPFFNSAEYHNLHHKIGKGNFGLFFSAWDDYIGTRLNKEYAKDPSAQLPTMTMEEFEAECKKGRKLTIINNSVVDCEKWINDHPGGKMVIEALISKDSTDSFTKIHGPSSHNKEGNNHANEMVKTLSIATLASR